MNIEPIAFFHSPLTSKFGIPRQSGLASELTGTIVFEPLYRREEAVRGLEQFDYLWIIWEFSANTHHPTPKASPFAHHGWAATRESGCLPRVRPSVQTGLASRAYI